MSKCFDVGKLSSQQFIPFDRIKVREMKRVRGIFGDPLLYCEGRQGHKNGPFFRGMRAHSETNVSIGLMGSMALDEKIPPTEPVPRGNVWLK